ncbi:hypothetical protein FDP41_007084 [Naegleria fowleri]|uniref:Uncharacterized protein n=1 Tax=Naegleria fowleri TaxID=5763 RepID=A0A6A5B8F6_NAEFO|nr:uncharacterized protein FDP41_007084 [Naegleria fowleri]KAF0973697.1 hypothetical protein FDP41_007084 [Naegleria fowleri]
MSQPSTKELYEAATKGDLSAVKKIVEGGKADLNAFMHVGIFDSEWVCILLVLIFSSKVGVRGLGKLTFLVRALSNTSFTKNPLHGAASKDNVEILEVLVKAGLNVNSKAYFGDTPLHIACYFGRVASVEELLRLGADRSIKNNAGKTPYEIAETRGQSMVSRLVKI